VTTDGARDLARAVRDLADRLPERLWPLARVAYNYRWCWAPGGEDVFRRIDAIRFERARANPVQFLRQLPAEVLERAAHDGEIVSAAERLQETCDKELAMPSISRGEVTSEHPVAFVCAEFGIHRSLPIYQGGLGVLAGDILKGSSDLRIPMVGVGILYSKGSFHQRIDQTGWQHDYWLETEPDRLPAALVVQDDGAPLIVDVRIGGRDVHVQVWRVQVGRVPLVLLDANREDNGTAERWITARLYVGDPVVRLKQYAMLGVGGIRVLRALGIEPSVVHVNEGHGAFAPLALAARDSKDAPSTAAIERAQERTIFTTHTPVAAGNETYDPTAVLDVLKPLIDAKRLRDLGSLDGGDIGMTSLGLRLARTSTAVSRRHGEVARAMWRPLFNAKRDEDVPITHVTNGVHVPTWMAEPMRRLLDRHLGADWPDRQDDPATWKPIAHIPDEELWATRSRLRASLVHYVREADAASRLGRYEDASAVEDAARAFDPERLTLGFARRVATYKRLHLLLRDRDRLESLLGKGDSIQFVIAGKAHPRDTEAKERLAQFIQTPWEPDVAPRIAFLEDYDIEVASRLVAGCDVWVNLPRPPLEASGTSGMKAALNGALNLSVLDGWWAEAYDGENGWAVGDGNGWDDPEAQDERDAEDLLDKIEHELLPLFHSREGDVPVEWVRRVKRSLMTIGPRFGTTRMLREYLERVYAPGGDA
jgi:glycogen phosphorylase